MLQLRGVTAFAPLFGLTGMAANGAYGFLPVPVFGLGYRNKNKGADYSARLWEDENA